MKNHKFNKRICGFSDAITTAYQMGQSGFVLFSGERVGVGLIRLVFDNRTCTDPSTHELPAANEAIARVIVGLFEDEQ